MRKEITAFQHSTHNHVQKQGKTHDCAHDVIHVVVYFQHVHEKHNEFQNDDENDGREHKPFHKRRFHAIGRESRNNNVIAINILHEYNISFIFMHSASASASACLT